MRNLFIGERSIQNDAILKILTSEVDQDFLHILPEQLEKDTDDILRDVSSYYH